MRAEEDVVPEGERHAVSADELTTDDERLRESFGRRLGGVLDMHPQLGSISQEPL
jgi:hypothetical protein